MRDLKGSAKKFYESNNLALDSSKAKKYIVEKKILKTIFVKNKIINYILKNDVK